MRPARGAVDGDSRRLWCAALRSGEVPLLLSGWLLFACADKDADSARTDPDADADTDTDGDADVDDGLPDGLVECPPEDGYDTLPDALTVTRYCLADPAPYADREGNPAAFDLVRPRVFATEDPHPVLVYLHGGVVGVDDIPGLDRFCFYAREKDGVEVGTETLIANAIYNHATILELVTRRDWVMLVPESDWCDLWSGMGELDPVDPTHRSLQHVENSLDVLSAGIEDLVVDEDRIYAWGTSIGAEGAWVLAGGHADAPHPIAGIVADSGPFSTVRWFEPWTEAYPAYDRQLTEILGGDPYEADGVTPSVYYPNYARLDVRLLLEAGLRLPAFVTWNSEDLIVEPYHGPYADQAIADVYEPAGVRAFTRDFDHHAPYGTGATFHTQTPNDGMPWAYTTVAAFDFLEGATVSFLEAEELCDEGVCTIVREDDPEVCPEPDCWGDNPVSPMASGTAAVRHVGESGVVFAGALPVDRGVPLQLRVVLQARDATGTASAEVARAELRAGDELLVSRAFVTADFAPSGGSGAASVDQVDVTTFGTDFDDDGVDEGLPDGDVRLTITTTGTADVYFDGVWVVAR